VQGIGEKERRDKTSEAAVKRLNGDGVGRNLRGGRTERYQFAGLGRRKEKKSGDRCVRARSARGLVKKSGGKREHGEDKTRRGRNPICRARHKGKVARLWGGWGLIGESAYEKTNNSLYRQI